MTFKELRSLVMLYTSDAKIDAVLADLYINLTLKYIGLLGKFSHLVVYNPTAITTSAPTYNYDLPSNFSDIITASYNDDVMVYEVPTAFFLRDLTLAGESRYYTIIPKAGVTTGIQQIYLNPNPILDAQTIKLAYVKEPATLTVDAAVPEVPLNYHMAIAYGAAALAWAPLEDNTRGARFVALFNQTVGALLQTEEQRGGFMFPFLGGGVVNGR